MSHEASQRSAVDRIVACRRAPRVGLAGAADARARMEDATRAGRSRSYQGSEDDGRLAITQFYARSGEITAGDRNLVCYGVRNATSVRIEPAVESISPCA